MMNTLTTIAGEERKYETPEGVFIIRDQWVANLGVGVRLDRCEYAVKGDDGAKVWKPCCEGVLFADIEPFEKVAA